MKFKIKKVLVFLIVSTAFVLKASNLSQSGTQSPSACDPEKGCKINVPTEPLTIDQTTANKIKSLVKKCAKKGIEQGWKEKKELQEQYKERIGVKGNWSSQNPDPPQFSGKKRLLSSGYNQYSEIYQGSYLQATSNDYIFELRGSNLTIFTVSDPKLTKVYQKTYGSGESPVSIHSSADGYFAVVVQNYSSSPVLTTAVKIYFIQNSKVTQLRQYRKLGYYSNSRQYRSEIILLIQNPMATAGPNYTWWLSDVGTVQDNVFDGVSGNGSANYTGYAARSLARIPLGPLSNKRYQFATYLFCDYSWDLLLSPTLNIFVPSNYYSSSGSTYSVTFQALAFRDEPNKKWGSSRWVRYPGLFNHIYQLHEFNGYFRAVLINSYQTWSTVGYISAIKVPMSTFDPNLGKLYNNLGSQGSYFLSSTWRRDLAFLMFRNGTIRTFSSSLGKITDEIQSDYDTYMLYPYGSSFMIGVGMTLNFQEFAILTFELKSTGLVYKQSLISNTSLNGQQPGFSATYLGWYGAVSMQFDWQNKRITFPVYSSQAQPYRSGYFHIYANPLENCMSTLPVPNPCPSDPEIRSTVFQHLMKHWDKRPNNDFDTGYSETISLSRTFHVFGKYILITTSYCQIQSRVLKGKNQPLLLANSTEVWSEDLCSY